MFFVLSLQVELEREGEDGGWRHDGSVRNQNAHQRRCRQRIWSSDRAEKDTSNGMRKLMTQWVEENIEKVLREGRNEGMAAARKYRIDEDRFSVDGRRKDLEKNTIEKKIADG